MKAFFLLLLIANAVLGAWLLLSGPLDETREPGRMDLQIEPNRFRLLSEADLAHMRSQAERAAVASAAAAAPKLDAAAVASPSVVCVEIGNFPSEALAKKALARLAAIGLSNRTTASAVGRVTRLRVTGVDGATEARINEILKDYPKQRLEHCAQTANAR